MFIFMEHLIQLPVTEHRILFHVTLEHLFCSMME